MISENCGPFGCTEEVRIDTEATAVLREEQPLGQFNGLGTYVNRNHLATESVAAAWQDSSSLLDFGARLMNLPLYKALAFTLTYTFVVAPLVLMLGLIVALGVNGLPRMLRGPTIFASLLPMIVTPLIGSLILFLDDRCERDHWAKLAVSLRRSGPVIEGLGSFDLDNIDRLRHLAQHSLRLHCILRGTANSPKRHAGGRVN